jgi:hypothetical protein
MVKRRPLKTRFARKAEDTPSAGKEYETENGRNGETESFEDKENGRQGDLETRNRSEVRDAEFFIQI